jgi:hypothetical protein
MPMQDRSGRLAKEKVMRSTTGKKEDLAYET